MSAAELLAEYAQVAQAAYATGLSPGQSANNAGGYIYAGMSSSQAQQFNAEWSVLEQSAPAPNGFSAVLMQNALTGEKVLAIAGTNGVTDLWSDYEFIFTASHIAGMTQYQVLESFYQQLITDGKLTATEQVVVTGHSLGGFLAQSFTALHASVVSAAYTYNAPGFGGATAQLLDFLGISDGSIADGKITNVVAADGVSVTAGLGVTLGSTVSVGIEASAVPWANHSIARLADSLAMQSVMATLDASLTQVAFNAFLKDASDVVSTALESLLDAVRTTLLGPVSSTASGDGGSSYYQNLDQLNQLLGSGGALQSLAGAVRIGVPSARMVSDARSAFSTLVALQGASPIVLNGTTSANQALLDGAIASAHAELYALWQADQALSQADRAAGKASISDKYLQARTRYVMALADARANDLTYSLTVKPGTAYIDVASNAVLANVANPYLAGDRQIIFCSGGARWFGGAPTSVTNVIGEAGLEIVPTALIGPKAGDIVERLPVTA